MVDVLQYEMCSTQVLIFFKNKSDKAGVNILDLVIQDLKPDWSSKQGGCDWLTTVLGLH